MKAQIKKLKWICLVSVHSNFGTGKAKTLERMFLNSFLSKSAGEVIGANRSARLVAESCLE